MGVLNNLGLRRPAPPPIAAKGRFQIDGVTVVNPMQGRRANATIEVSGGAIAAIVNTHGPAPHEFAGCFALPGLIDMHVHLPPDNGLKLTPSAALLYLQHGVTTLREAGDLDGTAVAAVRELERAGIHPVPRLFSCGPFVGAGKAGFKNTILLEDASARAADAAAVRVKATGATFLKFYEGLTEPMIRTLEQACAKHGLKMMGHVPAGMPYENARIAEVQHFLGVPLPQTLERDTLVNRSCDWHAVNERRMDEIVEASLKHGIANTPTIVTNQQMLCYRDFDAARRDPAMLNVPPFYLDVIWHPERGRSRATGWRAIISSGRWCLRSQKSNDWPGSCSTPVRHCFWERMLRSPSSCPAPACSRKWLCSQTPASASRRSGNSRRVTPAKGSASRDWGVSRPVRRPTSCCFAATRPKAWTTLRAWRRLLRQAGFIGRPILHKRCTRTQPISTHP